MKDSVGLLLPTRSRYVALQESLYSLSETEEAKELLDVFILADQDRESYDIANDFIHKQKFRSYKVIYSSRRLYPVKGFISLYNICLSEYFFWTTNRITYRKDWLVKALTHFNATFPDKIGVFAMGGKLNKANVGMSSKKFVEYNENSWFSPVYKMNFCDDELACRAVLLGRYSFLKEPLLTMNDSEELLYSSKEEKEGLKKVDRSVFYRRSENNFDLPMEKTWPWKGFREINLPIEKT